MFCWKCRREITVNCRMDAEVKSRETKANGGYISPFSQFKCHSDNILAFAQNTQFASAKLIHGISIICAARVHQSISFPRKPLPATCIYVQVLNFRLVASSCIASSIYFRFALVSISITTRRRRWLDKCRRLIFRAALLFPAIPFPAIPPSPVFPLSIGDSS